MLQAPKSIDISLLQDRKSEDTAIPYSMDPSRNEAVTYQFAVGLTVTGAWGQNEWEELDRVTITC
jgi:hypothetical protein